MGWGWTTVCKVGKRKRPFKLLLRPTILLMATWCKFPLFAACLCIPHTKNSVTQKASLNKPFNFQWIKVTGAGAATTMRTTAEAGTWCRLALNLSKRNGGDERKRERERGHVQREEETFTNFDPNNFPLFNDSTWYAHNFKCQCPFPFHCNRATAAERQGQYWRCWKDLPCICARDCNVFKLQFWKPETRKCEQWLLV